MPTVSLPFLDTSCQIVDGKIEVDLYRKETDRNQYLLTSSCHPAHVTENIPFSLAMRIVRICTLEENRELRFSELKQLRIIKHVLKEHLKTSKVSLNVSIELCILSIYIYISTVQVK